MNNLAIGWIGVAVAVLFFGSNFIPIKKYETGDGMFFQFVVCTGITFLFLFLFRYLGNGYHCCYLSSTKCFQSLCYDWWSYLGYW